MIIGLIRPVEARTVTVQGYEFGEIDDLIVAETPPGWLLVHAPVSMSKQDTILTAEARLERRDGVEEIEADDLSALKAKVPEGYLLLSVREV